MNKPARIKQAEIDRASVAAKRHGVRIKLTCGDMSVEVSPLDSLAEIAPPSPLQEWRRKKDARQA